MAANVMYYAMGGSATFLRRESDSLIIVKKSMLKRGSGDCSTFPCCQSAMTSEERQCMDTARPFSAVLLKQLPEERQLGETTGPFPAVSTCAEGHGRPELFPRHLVLAKINVMCHMRIFIAIFSVFSWSGIIMYNYVLIKHSSYFERTISLKNSHTSPGL